MEISSVFVPPFFSHSLHWNCERILLSRNHQSIWFLKWLSVFMVGKRKQFELWVGKRASGLWLLVRCCSNSINTDESVMYSTFRALYIVLTYVFHILYVCLLGACFEVESHGFIELNTCRKEKLSKTFLWRKWAKGELLGLHCFTLGPWLICSTSWQMTNESL